MDYTLEKVNKKELFEKLRDIVSIGCIGNVRLIAKPVVQRIMFVFAIQQACNVIPTVA